MRPDPITLSDARTGGLWAFAVLSVGIVGVLCVVAFLVGLDRLGFSTLRSAPAELELEPADRGAGWWAPQCFEARSGAPDITCAVREGRTGVTWLLCSPDRGITWATCDGPGPGPFGPVWTQPEVERLEWDL